MSRPVDEFGPRGAVPRLVPGVDLAGMPLDPQQAFVTSRVDGRTSLGDLCLLMPFGEAETVAILRKLHAAGIIEVPGVSRPRAVSAPRAAAPPVAIPLASATAPTPPAPAASTAPAGTTPAAATPTDGIDLTLEQRARIDEIMALAAAGDALRLLGVDDTLDEKALRKAYFKLAKEFHPDRHYGKSLGPYRARLETVFASLTDAFNRLAARARV